MGLLTQKDARLFRGFFKEMARLRGIPVIYRYATEVDTTIHSEFISTMSKPIPIDIIFDENPKISTLSRIGWVSEKPDDKPYIAMLSFDVPNLTAESTISIAPIDGITTQTRDFKITTINTLLEFPDCWICTLAPIFNNDPVKDNYDDSNYNYIETTETPDRDTDNNYKYLNLGE